MSGVSDPLHTTARSANVHPHDHPPRAGRGAARGNRRTDGRPRRLWATFWTSRPRERARCFLARGAASTLRHRSEPQRRADRDHRRPSRVHGLDDLALRERDHCLVGNCASACACWRQFKRDRARCRNARKGGAKQDSDRKLALRPTQHSRSANTRRSLSRRSGYPRAARPSVRSNCEQAVSPNHCSYCSGVQPRSPTRSCHTSG
jgi:hypothetical protein